MEEWQGGYTVVAGRRRMRLLSEGQPVRGTLRRPADEARLSQRQVEEEQTAECLTGVPVVAGRATTEEVDSMAKVSRRGRAQRRVMAKQLQAAP